MPRQNRERGIYFARFFIPPRLSLRTQLEIILDCTKLHVTLAALMADVAAVRQTVFKEEDLER
jgi:hypothetical protein